MGTGDGIDDERLCKLTSSQCFMYTTESLKVLVNIANSEKLRGYLRHIYLITALVKERPKHCPHHCLGHCWHPNVRQQEAFTLYLRDQQALRQNKAAKPFLVDAFSKLPRLTGLSLVDNTLEVPLSAEVRGLSKFQRTTGTIPHYAPPESATPPALLEHFDWQSHCWRSLMVAVAESGIKTLKKVETKMRSHLHGISPIDDLKFKSSTMGKLQDAFAELETFSVQFRSYAMRKNRSDGNSSMTRARKGLAEFTPILSHVTDFSVSFDLADQNSSMCKTLTSALDLSKLKKMKLDSTAIDGKVLGTILAGLTSVEMLTLHAIDLTSGNWVTMLKILKQLPHLQHLHLVYLQQSRQKVYFLKQLDEEQSANESAWEPMPDDMPDDMEDDDDDDWSEDYGSDDDEELPDLIPQETSLPNSIHMASAEEQSASGVESEATKKCAMYEDKDYKAPGQERLPERGYFICLPSRDEIEKQLPLFIEECNVGQDIMEDEIAGLGGLNGLLAALGGPVGGPGGIVLPVPMGAPPPAGQMQPPPPAPPVNNPPPNANGPGGQAGGITIAAALNHLFTGGGQPGHGHMQFTIPMLNTPNHQGAAVPPTAEGVEEQALPGATNVQAANANVAASGPDPDGASASFSGAAYQDDADDDNDAANDLD